MIRIFNSYTSVDEEFADKLATDLSSYTSDIFYTKCSIKVGDSIVDIINLGLERHDNIIVVLSDFSLSRINKNGELEYTDEPSQNFADVQLNMFITERLIEVITTKEGKVLRFTNLGESFIN